MGLVTAGGGSPRPTTLYRFVHGSRAALGATRLSARATSVVAGRSSLSPQVDLRTVGLDLAVDSESPEGNQHQDEQFLHGVDLFLTSCAVQRPIRATRVCRGGHERITLLSSQHSLSSAQILAAPA